LNSGTLSQSSQWQKESSKAEISVLEAASLENMTTMMAKLRTQILKALR